MGLALDEFFEKPRKKLPMTLHKIGRRKKTPKKNLEAGVIKECMIWLNRRGYYCERRNTGAIKTRDTFLRFGRLGAADIFAAVGGCHVEIECKRRDGKGRLSPSQKAFRREMGDYRIPYLVVTSAEDLEIQIGALRLHWTR